MPTNYNAIASAVNRAMENKGSGGSLTDKFNAFMSRPRSFDQQESDIDKLQAQNDVQKSAITSGKLLSDIEAANPGVDPKVARNRRIIAGIGDGISGIAGLVSAANGGLALNNQGKTAIGAVMDEQEAQRQKRKAEINEQYNTKVAAIQQQDRDIAAMRQRLNERRQRAYAEQKQNYENEYNTYRNQKAAADAQRAETQAQYQPQLSQSQIDKNNRTGVKTGGGSATKAPKQTPTFKISHSGGSFNIPTDKTSLTSILATLPSFDELDLPSDTSKGRNSNTQLVIEQYARTEHAKTNKAFQEAISQYRDGQSGNTIAWASQQNSGGSSGGETGGKGIIEGW